MTHSLVCRGYVAHGHLPVLFCQTCGDVVAIAIDLGGERAPTSGIAVSSRPPGARGVEPTAFAVEQTPEDEDAALFDLVRQQKPEATDQEAAMVGLLLRATNEPVSDESVRNALEVIATPPPAEEPEPTEVQGTLFEPHGARRVVDLPTSDRLPDSGL